jgi:hypothetical protein
MVSNVVPSRVSHGAEGGRTSAPLLIIPVETHSAQGRTLYRFYVSLVMLSAVAEMLFPSATMFIVTVLLFALTAYITLMGLLRGTVPLNCPSLMALGLAVYYGVGTLSALITAPDLFAENSQIGHYSFALLICVAVASGAAYLSFCFRSLAGHIKLNGELPEGNTMVSLIGFSLVMGAYVTGGLDAGGATQTDTRVSVLGTIAAMIAPAVPLLLYDRCFRHKRHAALAMYLALATSAVALVPLGRREIVGASLLAVIYFAAGNLKTNVRRFTLWFGAAALGAFLCSNIATATVRVVSSELDTGASLAERSAYAARHLRTNGLQDTLEWLSSQNRDRSFVLRFLADLLEASSSHAVMRGQESMESFKTAVPRVFGLKKFEGDIENISQLWYGLPVRDEANSLLTTGAADFGPLGAIVLPLLVALIFQVALSLAVNRTGLPEVIKRLLIMLFVVQLLNVESVLSTYLTFMRDLVVLILASLPAFLVLRLVRRRPGVAVARTDLALAQRPRLVAPGARVR